MKNTQNQNFDPTKPKKPGKMKEHNLLNTFQMDKQKGLRILKFDEKFGYTPFSAKKEVVKKLAKEHCLYSTIMNTHS